MTGWVEAGLDHRGQLQKFVCSAWLWRKLKKLMRAHPGLFSDTYDFWSSQIQGKIRDLKPPATPPRHIVVRPDAKRGRLDAVCFFAVTSTSRSEVLAAKIYLLGTHLKARRRGLAKEALDRVFDTLVEEAMARPAVRSIRVTAQVHKHNEPCRQLIISRGWSYDKMDVDNEHEWWVRVGDVTG